MGGCVGVLTPVTPAFHPVERIYEIKTGERIRTVALASLPADPSKSWRKSPDIELRLQRTAMGAKLLGLDRGDPEYGKKMYEAGAESVNRYWVGLFEKLKPHLSPEGLEVVDNEIRTGIATEEKAKGCGGG